MRFRLRTLLIILALGPPVLAAVWWAMQPKPFEGCITIIPIVNPTDFPPDASEER